MELAATAKCFKTDRFYGRSEKFSIKDGLKRIYDEQQYLSHKDSIFFNIGADLIYCCYQSGVIGLEDLEKHSKWFEEWKVYYESLVLDDISKAYAYAEFYQIAKLFDPSYSTYKLTIFYHTLTDEAVDNIDDLEELSFV